MLSILQLSSISNRNTRLLKQGPDKAISCYNSAIIDAAPEPVRALLKKSPMTCPGLKGFCDPLYVGMLAGLAKRFDWITTRTKTGQT